jgi:hypothetical protein
VLGFKYLLASMSQDGIEILKYKIVVMITAQEFLYKILNKISMDEPGIVCVLVRLY